MRYEDEIALIPGLNYEPMDNYHTYHQHHHHPSLFDLWCLVLDICHLHSVDLRYIWNGIFSKESLLVSNWCINFKIRRIVFLYVVLCCLTPDFIRISFLLYVTLCYVVVAPVVVSCFHCCCFCRCSNSCCCCSCFCSCFCCCGF